jgi:transketolase
MEELYFRKAVNNKIPCRKSFTNVLLEKARIDKDIIAVATDSRGSVTLSDFAKELPRQFVEVGIAEQNAIGIGAGLASTGKKVFVCGPACFHCARSLEQVKVDVAYSNNPVKILGVSGGVSYGALGSTHHSLHDIAVMRTFPGMQVVLPCDVAETARLAEILIDYPHPVFVRVGRNAVPDVYENLPKGYMIGKAITVHSGNDITVIATGEMVYHAQVASEMLEKEGIGVRVLDMHTIKPLDDEAIIKAAEETRKIITVEEHSIFGGLGGAVAEVICQNSDARMRILGIPDENAIHGKPLEIFAHYGLDYKGIIKAIKDFLK